MNLGMHHLRERRRISKGEPYPHPNKAIRRYDYFMYSVGIMAPLCVLPQAIQLYTTHNASGISFPTWALLGTINVLWVGYAILHKDYPVLVSNSGMAVLNLIVAFGVLMFR